MSIRSTSPLPAKLGRILSQLEKWRHTHKPPTRIPENLWKSAVTVAREYGLSLTAQVLSLDYTRLKNRLHGTSPQKANKREPSFVELIPSNPPGPTMCLVELEDMEGAKMRIHLKGSDCPEITAMIKAFRSDAL